MEKIKQRYRYSNILLRELVRTDFKLRYQNSVLGYLWSLLRPLLLFLILYLVFAKFLKVGNAVPHYPVYLLFGIVLWNYFTEVTSGAVGAIVGKGDLLRKINFPKYVIILAGTFSALINLFLNFIIIAIFMIFGHVGITWQVLWLIPLLLEMFVFSIGIAFLLSALFVKFRDVSYIWEVLLQAAFYATPILYPLTRVPHRFAKFLILNPMAQIIQDARYVLVTHQSQTIATVFGGDIYIWAIPLTLVIIFLVFPALYFRKSSKSFAEEV
ncbi:MAG: ABC transporter permease [Candidatus Saccharimonadales bacterium]